MTVYVDNMRAPYGRLTLCHMLADSDDELKAMAEKIGVALRWHQHPGKAQSHFDICLTKRALAVANGAQEITMREAALLIRKKRAAK